MTLTEAKLYVINAKNYSEIFGDNIFEQAAANFNVDDFTSYEYVIRGGGGDRYYHNKGYPVLSENFYHEFTEYNGEWERKVKKLARKYQIPNRYQCNESSLLKTCILIVNPAMENYQMNIYHFDNPDADIYIECDNKRSLYVPIKAIVQKNYDLVTKHHTAYFNTYYNRTDQKEYLDAALETLKTKTAKELKQTIENDFIPAQDYNKPKIKPEFKPRTVTITFDTILDGSNEAIEEKVRKRLSWHHFDPIDNISIKINNQKQKKNNLC